MVIRSATNKPMPSAQNTVNELLSSYNVSVSSQTVRNGLHSAGLKARILRKKPYISEVTRKRRLEFARKYKNNPRDFWKKLLNQNVLPTVKHGGGNIMVWRCVANNGAGNVAFINKMNVLAYIDVLRHNLLVSAKKLSMENTFIFQQDNDPKNTATVTKTWLLYLAPWRLQTSPQSPDLNPIENL
ncbi:transposable element Tc1 transposase [Trichonephila clavipes]|nr:transposable element Tc1 transposase [Trichonephila clavipes]